MQNRGSPGRYKSKKEHKGEKSWYQKAFFRGRKSPMFGIPLTELVAREGHPSGLPVIVIITAQFLEAHAKEDGLMRLSGAAEIIREWKKRFEAGKQIEASDLADVDPHVIASLLKIYIGALPEPLMTHNFYEAFITAQQIEEDVPRIKSIRNLVTALPPSHYRLLVRLIQLLRRIAEHSDVNQMTVSNLAIVIAPNILRHVDEDDLWKSMTDAPCLLSITKTLISEYEAIFEAPHDTAHIMSQRSAEEQTSDQPPTNNENKMDTSRAGLLHDVETFLDGYKAEPMHIDELLLQVDLFLQL